MGRKAGETEWITISIDLLCKSHKAPVPYPTMHHFVTEMCTCVRISVTKWCIVGYLSKAIWNLWNGSMASLWEKMGCPVVFVSINLESLLIIVVRVCFHKSHFTDYKSLMQRRHEKSCLWNISVGSTKKINSSAKGDMTIISNVFFSITVIL